MIYIILPVQDYYNHARKEIGTAYFWKFDFWNEILMLIFIE